MHFLLRFKAPLQSWGDPSKNLTKGSIRSTYECPTYSGMLGLINCCYGINHEKNFTECDELKSRIKHIATYSKHNHNILKDYQTMGGGYDTENPLFRNNGKRKIDGKVGVGFESEGKTVSALSTREYLEDSEFLVLLNVDDIISEEFEQNIKSPKWMPTFGRSCCIPSSKIFLHCSESKEECENIVEKYFGECIIYSSTKPNTTFSSLQIFDIPVGRFKNTCRTIFKSITRW